MTGFFISLEGGEGAGKTTVLNAVCDVLHLRGFEVLRTREPGGTEAGEAIRHLLLNKAFMLQAETELLLMFAARAQLVRELIVPALNRGTVVVSDRFTDASFAYQGGGRGIDTAHIAELERWAALIKPDLTFLLDLPVEVGMQRARLRGGELDRIEAEQNDFFERVRAHYRARAQREPQRFRVIDASQRQEQVVLDVTQHLHAWCDARV
jgi:dTMP kinase